MTDRRADERTEVPSHGPTDLPSVGRLLGVDWGVRRIGLAMSDPTQTLAQPLHTLTRRTGRRFPMARLRTLLDAHAPVGIVVGLPLEPAGNEGPAAAEARALGTLIAEKSELPVAYLDERMTTARVRSTVRELGGAPEAKPGDLDQLAATVLLQQYLDGRR